MREVTIRRMLVAALVVVATLAGGLAMVGYGALRGGLSTRVEPLPGEAWLASRARQVTLPRSERARVNPLPVTPASIAAGRAHFADHCASCHANDGRGRTALGLGMYPKPPDMTGPETQRLSDGELFWVIRNGVRFTGMPAFGSGPADKDDETWQLVHFIRRLPKLSDEELSEMRALNPVSRRELVAEEETEAFLAGSDVPADGEHHGRPEGRER